jgi:hypothetical protein
MEARDQPLLLKVGVRAPLTSVETRGCDGRLTVAPVLCLSGNHHELASVPTMG